MPERFTRHDWKAARTAFALMRAETERVEDAIEKGKGSTESLLFGLLMRRW